MKNQLIDSQLFHTLSERQYFLDWVRVLAFAFLIFYHTALMFVDWSFHIESGHNSIFLKSIMILSSQWRLDILFLVSGVAISYMITKMTLKSFTWQRVVKLYFPLLFAVAVVVAPQSYYEAIQKGVFSGSFWQFWTSIYFSLNWDERMQAPFPTYNHMWYILYLFHYSIILLPLFAFINTDKGQKVLVRIENFITKGTRIIWLPLAFYLAIYIIFDDHDVNHTFYNDWYGHTIFLFAVMMGVLFARMPKVWQSFENNSHITLMLGLMSYSVLLMVFLLPSEILPMNRTLMWGFTSLLVKWFWIALILGYAKKHLNYTNSTLKYCNGLIYPFFILHQTIIIIIGYYVIDWGMPAYSEFLIIVLSTFILCGLLYEFVIKRINILRLLFGIKMLKIVKKQLIN